MTEDSRIQGDSTDHPEDELSRILPKGRKLRDLPSELIDEQKAILFQPKKIIADRYEITEEIGFGGVGAVYRVQDLLLQGQTMILKIMLPSLVRSYDARERFITGAQQAKTLRHEGIVAVYDVGEDKDEDILFLIMELLEGQNLENYLEQKHGKLDFPAACDIILQICTALQYAHSRGVVHGGIKPRNIFILPDGKVKLLDFGLAKLLNPGRLTRFSIGFGIDCYMAPEQSSGKEIDGRADIFALGVVFYQMLIRQEPFYFKWPSGVDAVIKGCLKPRPEERFKDIASLKEEIRRVGDDFLQRGHEPPEAKVLERAVEEEHPVIVTEKHPERQAEQRSKKRESVLVLTSFVLFILAIIVTGGYKYFTAKDSEPLETDSQPAVSAPVLSATQASAVKDKNGEEEFAEGISYTPLPEQVTLEPPKPRDSIDSQKVKSLLAKAQEQLKLQKYTSPFMDNAYMTLQEILTSDPDNADAERMIETIRDQYIKKGEGAFGRKDYLNSGVYFQKALYVSPGYPPAEGKIQEINNQLRRTSAPHSRAAEDPLENLIDREIEKLLARAEQQLRAEQYTYPTGENAFLTAHEVLKMDPDNREAEVVLEKMRDEYMKLGEGAFRKRDYKKARRHFGKALYVYPGFVPARERLEEVEGFLSGKVADNPGTMVLIQGGCYEMGDVSGNGDIDERPVHSVCLDDFHLDAHEVTQGEFREVIGYSPSEFRGETLPVTSVTWFEARKYCEKVRKRLPSEAEWEFAARSRGRNSEWSGTTNDSRLGEYAWYRANSQGKNAPVGMKRSNGLGLYDMSGNMFEWVQDWYGDRYYERSARNNPQGPDRGGFRVLRGGSWNADMRDLRTSNRFWAEPDKRSDNVGFRCARSA